MAFEKTISEALGSANCVSKCDQYKREKLGLIPSSREYLKETKNNSIIAPRECAFFINFTFYKNLSRAKSVVNHVSPSELDIHFSSQTLSIVFKRHFCSKSLGIFAALRML